MNTIRTRWAAVGAAIAITLGAGGTIGIVGATISSGTKTVLVPITPCRIIDTRPAFQVGPKSSPLGPAETLTVDARGTSGDCNIPNDAVALSTNVTAVGATLPTFLTVWATGAARPDASSLNPSPDAPPTPNAVTTELSSDGEFDVYNLQGNVHLLIDVNGYYANHNHDDRYYRKSQVDAANELRKFLSINVYSDPGLNWDERYASLTDDGVGGLNLDVDFNFTVPPDYTPGGDIEFRLLAYARDSTTFPCNGELSGNWIAVSRAGAAKQNLGAGGPNSDIQPADILKVFTAPDTLQEYVFFPGPDVDIQPLDAVGFGLSGFGPATRCDLIISGVSVHYE